MPVSTQAKFCADDSGLGLQWPPSTAPVSYSPNTSVLHNFIARAPDLAIGTDLMPALLALSPQGKPQGTDSCPTKVTCFLLSWYQQCGELVLHPRDA